MCRFCEMPEECICGSYCSDCNGPLHIPLKSEYTYVPSCRESMSYVADIECSMSEEDLCDCPDCYQSPSCPPTSDTCNCCGCTTTIETERNCDCSDCRQGNTSRHDGNIEETSRTNRPQDSRRSGKYRSNSSQTGDQSVSASSVSKFRDQTEDDILNEKFNECDGGGGSNNNKGSKLEERSYKFCGRVFTMPQYKPAYRNVTLSMPMGSRDTEIIAKEIKPRRTRTLEPPQEKLPKLRVAFRRAKVATERPSYVETRVPVDNGVQPPIRPRIHSARFAIKQRDLTPGRK